MSHLALEANLAETTALQWRHNGADGVTNHWRLDCLLGRLFRRRSKKTSKLRVTVLYERIHRWPMDSPHKGPVTWKMFPFDDIITDNIHTGPCFMPHGFYRLSATVSEEENSQCFVHVLLDPPYPRHWNSQVRPPPWNSRCCPQNSWARCRCFARRHRCPRKHATCYRSLPLGCSWAGKMNKMVRSIRWLSNFQDCSNSSALAMELLQSYTKPSNYSYIIGQCECG